LGSSQLKVNFWFVSIAVVRFFLIIVLIHDILEPNSKEKGLWQLCPSAVEQSTSMIQKPHVQAAPTVLMKVLLQYEIFFILSLLFLKDSAST